jgi:DNA topoisomerase-1
VASPFSVSAGGQARLCLVHDYHPGFRRSGRVGAFNYFDEHGEPVEDAVTLERIRHLALPPAWTGVWIAADPLAHLQATGFDSRGRKQYRYHAAWRQDRDHLKFEDMLGFGRVQPALRRRVRAALEDTSEPLGHVRIHALSLRLLDIGLLRVGSDRYARDNHHYGLTTLRRHNLRITPSEAIFDYVGKAGKRHRLAITDAQALEVLATLKRRRQGPEELLVFRGAHGWNRIHREDVNNFLRAESGGPFSAKEYRTWNATVIAAATLAARQPRVANAAGVASKTVAEALGNTPTIARKAYIDTRVFEHYATGEMISLSGLPADPWRARSHIESRVLAMLDP